MASSSMEGFNATSSSVRERLRETSKKILCDISIDVSVRTRFRNQMEFRVGWEKTDSRFVSYTGVAKPQAGKSRKMM